uniref:tRNA (guanine(26)-N(2))-dimethyltransferase n=1 Tax=Blastobotrys adeninivorans TaxID=409370 RepID=A0A060T461_BLAAD
METVTEGKASVLKPEGNEVFYNPVQQFNRDISTLGIRAWSEIYQNSNRFKKRTAEGEVKPFIDIVEALSATGLRAIRYGKEIPLIRKVIANDMSPSAVEAIRKNVEYNEIGNVVVPNQGDANGYMHQRKAEGLRAHVVDLDPYGTAAMFIDAAVQSVVDDGLLLVTCTDLGVLAGNSYPEKCFALYGGTTVHSDACHESALRLVLNMVASTAAKYGKAIEPLLSLSIDFYVRCFIRIKASPQTVKLNHSKTMVVYHCNGCNSVTNQPLGHVFEKPAKEGKKSSGQLKYVPAVGPKVPGDKCQHCGSSVHISGPMWGGPLHDQEYIDKMLEIHSTLDPEVYGTLPRIEGMLTLARQELPDAPFYFSLPSTSHVIKAPSPDMTTVASALLNSGYKVSETHCKATCLKTDAPYEFIWDLLRQWCEKNKKDPMASLKEGTPGYNIMTKPSTSQVSFETNEQAKEMEARRKSKLVRFQMNPTENWGPKGRAK